MHSNFALACARGLIDVPNLDAETIALKSMKVRRLPASIQRLGANSPIAQVAADLCIHTNHNFVVEKINFDDSDSKSGGENILSAPEKQQAS